MIGTGVPLQQDGITGFKPGGSGRRAEISHSDSEPDTHSISGNACLTIVGGMLFLFLR